MSCWLVQGLGLQTWGCVINIVGQFCIAGPCALIAAFVLDWGIVGLLSGLGVGVVIQACCYIVLLTRIIDWSAMAAKIAAEQQAEAQTIPTQTKGAAEREPPDLA